MRNSLLCLVFLALLVLSCSDDDDTLSPTDREGIFEQVWKDFDDNYSYFEVKGIDWDSIYDLYRPQIINGETSSFRLEEILAEITLALQDLHVNFTSSSSGYRYSNRGDFPANSPRHAINYLKNFTFENSNITYAKVENTNIAYLRVKHLSQAADFSQLENVVADLPNKDALILDLRDNGGGSDAIARSFVNRLTKEERVHELVRFRNGPEWDDFEEWREVKIKPDNPIDFDKPIVVIINRGVVSSAEAFVTMMKVLPNTTLIGDTTRGSTGNPAVFRLPNSWSYRISRWQAVTPDFKFIEDNGIAPGEIIYNTEESDQNGQDLMLERAIEILESN